MSEDRFYPGATKQNEESVRSYGKKRIQRELIRDSAIVLPVLMFTILWCIFKFGLQIDFSPGSDYFQSVLYNFLVPIAIIVFGQIVYAIVLMTDVLRSSDRTSSKVLYCLVVWLATNHLFYVVYIVRVVSLIKKRKKAL